MTTPVPAAPRARSVPLLALAGIVVAALTGLTWALGGFEKATDRLDLLDPGTTVDMGPMTIAVDRAVANKPDFADRWSVDVYGRCQNTTDEALDPAANRLARNGFGLQDPRTMKVVGDAALTFVENTFSDALNPGLPPRQCRLTFDLGPDFVPANYVSVGVSQVEFIDSSITGTKDMAWSATRVGWRFNVPLTVQAR